MALLYPYAGHDTQHSSTVGTFVVLNNYTSQTLRISLHNNTYYQVRYKGRSVRQSRLRQVYIYPNATPGLALMVSIIYICLSLA